jgi:hypothetical protein
MSRRRALPLSPIFRATACSLVLVATTGCEPRTDGPEGDAGGATPATFEPNYDEAQVPEYTLPDPLVTSSGQHVEDAETWRAVRRPEILALFEEHVYGPTPEGPYDNSAEVLSVDAEALGGIATRKEVRIRLTDDPAGPSFILLMYLPNHVEGPAPTFLALNYYGNASVHPDPAITLTDQWMADNADFGIVDHHATEASRGVRSWRWPVERILERGYGLATAHYGDIDPDFDDGFQNGIHPYFEDAVGGPGVWGSIGAWAWGLSRAMDHLVEDPDVDTERVIVMGHSRLGKTALWAGAQDERFAMVVSNDSGAGGAALSRRAYGETVRAINDQFPHWFTERFKTYNENESALPVDQHMLLALVAPRPLYVASAIEDQWADPRGEFLSAFNTGPVYALFGHEALPVDSWPPVDTPVAGRVGYHVRSGGHDVLEYDWERYMDFADAQLRH